MYDLLPKVNEWMTQGIPIALAVVVKTWESTPRIVGSKMFIAKNGEMVGSVSGGCVEAAGVEEAGEVIKGGKPKLLHYRISDENTWDIGLSCGGGIDVFLRPYRENTHEIILKAVADKVQLAWITILQGHPDLIQI